MGRGGGEEIGREGGVGVGVGNGSLKVEGEKVVRERGVRVLKVQSVT